MLNTKIKKQAGFTIVELLIVIVVIGILAALVLNTFQGVQARARDTERRTDINSVATQLEVYYNDFGHYPDGSTATTCGDGTESCELDSLVDRGLDAGALTDPNENAINVGTNGNTNNQYYYDVTDATNGASNCTTGQCSSFVLSVDLESEDETYTKNSLN